jgi:hypothetical protein
MRCLLIGVLALVGCGSVDVAPAPLPASGLPCVTSFGCPAAERCDEGKCAADVGCPGAVAPRVIYENPDDTSYPYIISVGGREYLERSESGSLEPGTDLDFLDLATGKTSVFHHALGYAGCSGDPLWCTVNTTTQGTVLTGLTLDDASQAWSAKVSHDFPAGYGLMGISPEGRFVLFAYDKPDLQLFDPATGVSEKLIDLGGRTAMRVVALPSGPVVTAYTHSSQAGTSASFAPLVPGAEWTTILETPEVVANYWLAIPAGKAWFLIGDFVPSGNPQSWQVSSAGTTKAGPSDDPLVFSVADRYSRGEPLLLDGTRGKGVACKDATCQSGEVDFATLKRRTIGSVTLPGATYAQVAQERWLACDAVDAMLEVPIQPAGPGTQPTGYKLYAVRIQPTATP